MIRFHSPFNGKRFIGDKIKSIFHDSLFEARPFGPGGCCIEDLSQAGIKTFEPDDIATAMEEGYSPCPKCLKQLKDKRQELREGKSDMG